MDTIVVGPPRDFKVEWPAAYPTEALETFDVQVEARLGMQEPIAEPISAPVTEMERRAGGSHSPFMQARWWAHPEA